MPTVMMPPPTADNAVLALSVLSAIAHLPSVLSQPGYTRMATKTSSTALLSLLAHQRAASPLLTGALGLGSLGDAFLAWDGDDNFLRGLASFLIAHLLYLALLARSGGGVDALLGEAWRAGAATFFLAVLAPTMVAVLMPRVARGLRVPILVYSAVIAAMVAASLTTDNHVVIGGAVLFATSDAILSVEKFLVGPSERLARTWMRYAVWVLYYSGQLLIALGITDGPTSSL